MDSIDRMIYRPSRWIIDTSGRTVSELGLEIRNVRQSTCNMFTVSVYTCALKDLYFFQITVHNTSSDSSDMRTRYNRDNPDADAIYLLNDMRFGDWGGYCLAHLFTNRNFASGLLGLANIASPFAGQTGGICSRGTFSDLVCTHVYLHGQVGCTLCMIVL